MGILKKFWIFILSLVLMLNINCSHILNQERREKVYDHYESLYRFLDENSYVWSLDKLGKNEVRILVCDKLMSKFKYQLLGSTFDKFMITLRSEPDSTYNGSKKSKAIYFLNGMISDSLFEPKSLMILYYDDSEQHITNLQLLTKEKNQISPQEMGSNDFFSFISSYWRNDTMGLNGFRNLAYEIIKNRHYSHLQKMDLTKVQQYFGKSDEYETVDGNIELTYYIKRAPSDPSVEFFHQTYIHFVFSIDGLLINLSEDFTPHD